MAVEVPTGHGRGSGSWQNLYVAPQAPNAPEPAVHGDQSGIETFSEGEVNGVPSPDARSELSGTGEEGAVAVALSGPVAQILDRLAGCSRVEVARDEFATQDIHHLDVDDVRGRLVWIVAEALPHKGSLLCSYQHLEKT